MTDRNWSKPRLFACVAVVIGLLTATQPARAEDAGNILALTGIDVGGHSVYGYAGGVAGLAPLTQSGPLVRLWADHLSYDLNSGARKVTARGFGENASVGYQWVYAGNSSLAGYAGVNHRNTTVPAGVASREKGSKTNARVEADWFQQLTDNLNSHIIASLVTGTVDYWVRARLWYQTPMKIAFAPEFVYLGNPDFKAHRFGAAAQASITSAVKATIDAGFEKNSHFPNGAYGGFALSVLF